MQDATARMRAALGQFDSGLAAHRALAEGQAPRNIALRWFKREMSLVEPLNSPQPHGVFGLSSVQPEPIAHPRKEAVFASVHCTAPS